MDVVDRSSDILFKRNLEMFTFFFNPIMKQIWNDNR